MRKYVKKLLVTLLSVVGVVCLTAGLAACGNDEGPDDGIGSTTVVPLIAPKLTLTENVLSWNAVPHATGYAIYEGEESIAEQAETSYTITQDYPGTYSYTVKAITTEKGYKESPLSAAVTYTVAAWPLEAPVISIDQDTGIISWGAVEHADGYDVYQEGVRIASVYELSYTIEETDPDVYSFTVRATSTDRAYSTSAHSEPATYKVPLHLTFVVEFPASYSGEVTINLYDAESDQFVDRTTAAREEGSDYGSARLVVKEWGSYIAKIENLNGNYVATWAHVSTNTRRGSITIIEKVNSLASGTATVSGTIPAEEREVTVNYVFTAGASEDGYHSIIVDESATGLQISAAGKTVINTSQGIYKGSFATLEGEVFIISVTFTRPSAEAEEDEEVEGEEVEEEPTELQASYQIEIVNYEVKVPLRILFETYDANSSHAAEYNNYINYIYDSCVRHIEGTDITVSGTYEIFIPSAHAENTFITLTINGQSYNLSGGGVASVHLNAGEDVRLEFELSITAETYVYVYLKKADSNGNANA